MARKPQPTAYLVVHKGEVLKRYQHLLVAEVVRDNLALENPKNEYTIEEEYAEASV